jgi:hypothetical protein
MTFVAAVVTAVDVVAGIVFAAANQSKLLYLPISLLRYCHVIVFLNVLYFL